MFYRIKTNLTKEQSEKIVDSLTPIEVERLESYKLKAYDEEIEGQINSYIISDRYVFTRILLFLRQKSIDFEYEDSYNLYSDTLIDELKKAIFNLKPEYRDIILAIDFEGYSYNEISLITGIPKGTLMSRHHRAISILHKTLNHKKEI